MRGIHRSLHFANHARRIARHDPEVWHVLCDNASGADYAPSAESHAWQNDDVAANPDVVADADFHSELRPFDPIANARVQRVRGAVERDVGSEQAPRPDGHRAGVEDCAVEVDEDARSYLDVAAVVELNWRKHPRVVLEERLVFFLRASLRWQCRFINYDPIRAQRLSG